MATEGLMPYFSDLKGSSSTGILHSSIKVLSLKVPSKHRKAPTPPPIFYNPLKGWIVFMLNPAEPPCTQYNLTHFGTQTLSLLARQFGGNRKNLLYY